MSMSPQLIPVYAKQLRLPTMIRYDEVTRIAEEQGWGYDRFLYELLDRELQQRQANQQKRRIKAAQFPLIKSLDEFHFNRVPNIEEALVWQLATGEFVQRKENVILIGNPGAGKTHLAIGIGLRLCREGYRVRFYTASNLATELLEAQEARELRKLEKSLVKVDLLILDELSYLTFSKSHAELLFHVLSARNERGSVIITTNLQFSRWTEIFPDAMLTAALIDRLTHHSHILDMNTPDSFRRQESLRRKRKQPTEVQTDPVEHSGSVSD